MSAFRKERKTILAKNIFSGEEVPSYLYFSNGKLLEIEKKVFGDKYTVKAPKREDSTTKQEANKSQKTPNGVSSKSGIPSLSYRVMEAPVNSQSEPPAKGASSSKKKKKKKESQQPQPVEVEPEQPEIPEPKKEPPKGNSKKYKEAPEVHRSVFFLTKKEPAPEPVKPKSKPKQAPTKVVSI